MGTNFIKNRARLFEQGLHNPLVLTAHAALQVSNDSGKLANQESYFWWMTGIDEPNWWVIIDPQTQKTWLVQPRISATHQIFDGSLTADAALEMSGADGILSSQEARKKLHELTGASDTVLTLGAHPHKKYFDFVPNPAEAKLRARLKKLFKNVEDCRPLLSKLRAIKQPEELDAIKSAIAITAKAFEQAKHNLSQRSYEYEVEADFTYAFRRANTHHAYEPIVASGANAVTLHYVKNDCELKNGLLLIDIGARVGGYAADITRTYAVGEVSQRDRDVHRAVQKAQEACISLLGPGVSIKEYSEHVDQIMKDALKSLNLLKKATDYRNYFPHSISHGLGVDVHDSLGGFETFEPGMVLTVEPGIYIPEEGIGVRIEDDILITESGHENLSAALSTDL